jgi:hypothetical protein
MPDTTYLVASSPHVKQDQFENQYPAKQTISIMLGLVSAVLVTHHQQLEAIKRRDHGEESLDAIGRSYNVSGRTIARPDKAAEDAQAAQAYHP